MYFYVYDSFLGHKRYDRLLSDTETRLNEVGINGKINRLSVLTNMKDTIEHGIRHGAKTVVIVGNDQTFSEATNTVAQFPKIVLGFVPVGSDDENALAAQFNIPIGVEACDALSARIIRKVPLGKVNNNFFLISAQILSPNATIRCDDKYNISLVGRRSLVSVYNVYEEDGHTLKTVVGPLPGALSGRNQKKTAPNSVFFHEKISVTSPDGNVPVLLDENQTVNTPVEISVASEKIQLIAGKEDLS